jgi:hypothetical protein
MLHSLTRETVLLRANLRDNRAAWGAEGSRSAVQAEYRPGGMAGEGFRIANPEDSISTSRGRIQIME